MAQLPSKHCPHCAATVQPNARFCTACGFPLSHEWRNWPPVPDHPAPSASRPPEDPPEPYIPLQLAPVPPSRNHHVRRAIALLILLVSGALLGLSELLLRDGYDRLAWGIVWFTALGVMLMVILWWCREGAQALRRRRRHRL